MKNLTLAIGLALIALTGCSRFNDWMSGGSHSTAHTRASNAFFLAYTDGPSGTVTGAVDSEDGQPGDVKAFWSVRPTSGPNQNVCGPYDAGSAIPTFAALQPGLTTPYAVVLINGQTVTTDFESLPSGQQLCLEAQVAIR